MSGKKKYYSWIYNVTYRFTSFSFYSRLDSIKQIAFAFKAKKSNNANVVLNFLPHAKLFISMKVLLKSKNCLYRITSNQNRSFSDGSVTVATGPFGYLAQLYYLLSPRSNNHVKFPVVSSRTAFLHLDLLSPQWHWFILCCRFLHQGYSSLE